MLPTITIDNKACLGPLDCGECMRICPMTIFIAGPTKKWKFRETDNQDYKVYARYYDQCVTCFKCVEVCPEECIAVTVDADNGAAADEDED
jgi:formate hydrogenlyase subunit 6/NADH:ubiquinone oxidoreductase subunit I